jgi:hypothetical protein
MFSLRPQAWLYEKVWFVPDMFPRSGQPGIDPGGNQKQLVMEQQLTINF